MKDCLLLFSYRKLKFLIMIIIFCLFVFSPGSSSTQIRRRYHGIDLDFPSRRCSMEIMGAEVADVLRTFANQYKLNLVISEDVSGKIDLVLKSVPVQEAFLTILRSAKLAYIKEGEILRIMSLEKLAEENKVRESSLDMETRIFRPKYASASRLAASMRNLLSKREGAFIDADERTNFLVVKDIPQKLDEMENLSNLLDVEEVTQVRPVETEIVRLKFIDAKEIGKNAESMISESGKIEINEKTNALIISDISENLGQIKALIQNLDKPSRQVHIEAKIVETTKNFIKALGIQWGGRYSESPPSGKAFPKVSIQGTAQGPISKDNETETGLSQDFAVNLPPSMSYGAINLSLGHIKDKILLDIQLSAMEDKKEGRILSTPSIVTLDNTQATIETGARVPFQTFDELADRNVFSVEYVDALTKLEVTPHITSDNRIKLKIVANKDRPDFTITIAGNPLISRKAAQTELIVKDGETTVIGGLSVADSLKSQNRVPWLAELPVVGYLFRNNSNTKTYEELLIFITPHIIEN